MNKDALGLLDDDGDDNGPEASQRIDAAVKALEDEAGGGKSSQQIQARYRGWRPGGADPYLGS